MRFGVGLRLLEAPVSTFAWTNVPAGGQATAHVSYVPPQRGVHDVPTLSAEKASNVCTLGAPPCAAWAG